MVTMPKKSTTLEKDSTIQKITCTITLVTGFCDIKL